MKKLIITAAVTAVTVAAFAQGQVQFAGYSTADLSLQFPSFNSSVYVDTVGGAPITGSAGRAEMLGASAATAVASVVSTSGGQVKGNLVDLYNPNSTTISWVNFGTATSGANINNYQGKPAVGSNKGRILNDTPYSGAAVVQIAAWYGTTASQYSTWAQAFNAAYGIGTPIDTALKIGVSSPVSVGKVSTGSSDGSVPFPAWSSFAVISVPEPTTAAIAGLGLASMLIFRRKKA